MPEAIIRALRRQRTCQLKENSPLVSAWIENGLGFATPIGTPLEPRSAASDFKRILEKTKLPSTVRFHDLRHSAASLLLAQGVQLRAIMELLGHSTIALTANTYTHLMPSMMADKVETLLGV
jgi:site-specific recombinase XerD